MVTSRPLPYHDTKTMLLQRGLQTSKAKFLAQDLSHVSLTSVFPFPQTYVRGVYRDWEMCIQNIAKLKSWIKGLENFHLDYHISGLYAKLLLSRYYNPMHDLIYLRSCPNLRTEELSQPFPNSHFFSPFPPCALLVPLFLEYPINVLPAVPRAV